jgi:hypothetical protein
MYRASLPMLVGNGIAHPVAAGLCLCAGHGLAIEMITT